MNKTKRVAFGGVISAFSLVVMLLSGVFPFAEDTCPALAGILLIALVIDFNKRTALLAYVVIALLSLLISANKESAVLFLAFLGYYPILKSSLEQIKLRVIEWILKLVIFNAAIILSYYVIVNVFGMSEVLNEMNEFTKYGVPVMLGLGNITFVIYDIALTRLIGTYIQKIKPKLKHII